MDSPHGSPGFRPGTRPGGSHPRSLKESPLESLVLGSWRNLPASGVGSGVLNPGRCGGLGGPVRSGRRAVLRPWVCLVGSFGRSFLVSFPTGHAGRFQRPKYQFADRETLSSDSGRPSAGLQSMTKRGCAARYQVPVTSYQAEAPIPKPLFPFKSQFQNGFPWCASARLSVFIRGWFSSCLGGRIPLPQLWILLCSRRGDIRVHPWLPTPRLQFRHFRST